jgi:BirA family transcriptional regulator, biotin operon repressor / biotin---[acetyl-CoA-carboxylase] ligase
MTRADASTALRERLIGLLADGEFHSGEHLARSLGVSRTAVWKHLQGFGELGLELHKVQKRGYRLARPIDLLDAATIRRLVSPDQRRKLRSLDVLSQTDSTNSRLLAVSDLPAGRADVCVAEFQSAGRGRRGRDWIAPFGGAICLSLGWLFPESPRQLSALSLAVGVAVLRALERFDARDIGLKWPNDVLVAGRKVGGVLCELRAEAGGPAYVVIGVGLNVRLGALARRAIAATGVQAADLDDAHISVKRDAVVAALIDELIAAVEAFQREGLLPFIQAWRDADALHGAETQVVIGEALHRGIARGIDADGALMLETPAGVLRFVSGEVTVRPAA